MALQGTNSARSVFDLDRDHLDASKALIARLPYLRWLPWLIGMACLLAVLGVLVLVMLGRLASALEPGGQPAVTVTAFAMPAESLAAPLPIRIYTMQECFEFGESDRLDCSNKKRSSPPASPPQRLVINWRGDDDPSGTPVRETCELWSVISAQGIRPLLIVLHGGHDLTSLGAAAQQRHDSNHNLAYQRAFEVRKLLLDCDNPLGEAQFLIVVRGSRTRGHPPDRKVQIQVIGG